MKNIDSKFPFLFASISAILNKTGSTDDKNYLALLRKRIRHCEQLLEHIQLFVGLMTVQKVQDNIF